MKKIFKSLFFISGLLIFLAGCNFNLQQKEQQKVVEEKVTITISTKFEDQLARKAYCDQTQLTEYYESLVYTLTSTDSNKTTSILFENINYEELGSYSKVLSPDQYIFTLAAFDSETKEQILSDAIKVDLEEAAQTLVFNMKPVEGTKGNVNLKIKYSSSYVSKIDGKDVYPAFKLYYKTFTSEGLSEEVEITKEEYEVINEVCDDGENVYYHEIDFKLPVEKYFISAVVNYTDINGNKKEEYISDELVYVSPNQYVFFELNVSTFLCFHANNYTDEEGEDCRNYVSYVPFVDIVPGFEKTFKKDDIYKVTVSGKVSKAINASVLICTANTKSGYWSYLGGTTIDLDLPEGGYFTRTVTLKLEKDSDSFDTQKLCFIYDHSYLDDAIYIYDYEIDLNLDPVKYTYHIGGLTQTDVSISGESYKLLKNLDLDRVLLGWYDNPDFTGSPVTEISADDNTTNRDFYAKYNLLYVDWEDDGDDWTNFGISFDELGLELPEPDKIITFILKAKPSVSVDSCGFSSNLANLNPWESFSDSWNALKLVKDEEFTLRCDFVVPSDFDITDTSAEYGFAVGTGDVQNLVLSDWTIDVEYKDFSTTFENENIKAEAVDEGIKFTVSKTENMAYVNSITMRVNDKDGVKYSFHNIDNGNSEILYPFVEADKDYIFQFEYGIRIDENDSRWTQEKVYIHSKGGSGEIDYTPYKQISLSLTGEETVGNHRYFIADGFDGAALQEMMKNMEDVSLDLSVWYGETWEQFWGNSFIMLDESDSIFNALQNNGKFDIIEYASPESIKKAAEFDTYRGKLNIRFNPDEYGHFELPEISTSNIKYIPVSKLYKVTFIDGSDGNIVQESTIFEGEKIVPPDFCEREGYTFKGWYNGDELFDLDTPITEDIVLTAKWSYSYKPQISIVFDSITSENPEIEYDYDDASGIVTVTMITASYEPYVSYLWSLNGGFMDEDSDTISFNIYDVINMTEGQERVIIINCIGFTETGDADDCSIKMVF